MATTRSLERTSETNSVTVEEVIFVEPSIPNFNNFIHVQTASSLISCCSLYSKSTEQRFTNCRRDLPVKIISSLVKQNIELDVCQTLS